MKILSEKASRWWPFGVLMVGGFLLFANSFGHQWTFDDYMVLVRNPDIRSWADFFRDSYPGRPLRELTYLLDHTLFGLKPAGYHIQNIFWHGLNAFLLYLVVLRCGGRLWTAWVASLIFLTHPLAVEVVANVSHRKDSLVVAFSLLALLAFARVYDEGRRGWLWLSLALLLTAVAYQGKQTAVGLFPVFLVYDLCVVPAEKRKLRIGRRLAIVLLAGVGTAVVAWYIHLLGDSTFRALIEQGLKVLGPAAGALPGAYFMAVFKALAFMVLRVFWPVDLAVEYTFAPPAAWSDPWVVAGLVVLVSGAALAVACRRRFPLATLALVWMAGFWLPVSNLLYPLSYFAADRYFYAPLLGFAVLGALLVGGLSSRSFALKTATVLAIVGVLGGLSWQQNRVWASEGALYEHAVAVSPSSSKALIGLGMDFLNRNELEEAQALFDRAAQIGDSARPVYLLGLVHERRGEKQLAIRYYKEFLLLDDPRFRKEAIGVRNILRFKYHIPL